MLRSCINIRKSQNFDELGKLAGNDNPIDKDETLENTKEYFLNEYKKRIQTSQHPTVWEEIKRQREILPQIKALFEALPEALQW
jgi:hypothetical protein